MTGTNYSNLFHVTDWFPTLLDFADIDFTADDDYELDGVSHYKLLMGWSTTAPRDYMLYNSYYNVEGEKFDYDRYTNQSFAVRDSQ